MKNQRNDKQLFADLVSLEAWHDEFTQEHSTASLFANVVFGEAKMGGNSDADVTFRMKITRAEIVIVVSDFEPVSIDPREVERFLNKNKILRTETQERELSGAIGASGGLEIDGLTQAKINLSTNAEGEIKTRKKETIEKKEEINLFEITQSKDNDQNYRWIIEQLEKKELEGSPWDPNKTPLVTLMDTRNSTKHDLPPSIRLVVRCLREDIEISDLKVKNPEKVKGWKTGKKIQEIDKANLRAAEALIRNSLTEYGLDAGKLDEDFSEVVLGSVLATSLPRQPIK